MTIRVYLFDKIVHFLIALTLHQEMKYIREKYEKPTNRNPNIRKNKR